MQNFIINEFVEPPISCGIILPGYICVKMAGNEDYLLALKLQEELNRTEDNEYVKNPFYFLDE